MSLGGNRVLGLRRPLLALVVAGLSAASLALVPSVAAADDGGRVVLPPTSYTASACAGETPIVVASDAAAQSDLYSAVTLAGVVDTDCIVLAGGRGESWPPDQRARLNAADADGYVVGGLAAVPGAKVAGLSLKRVAGADRWETARLVGNEARSLAGADEVDAAASIGAEDPTTDCTGDIPIVVASDAAARSDLYSAVTLAGVIGTDCIVLAGDRDDAMAAAQRTRLNAAAEGGFVVGGIAAVPSAKIAGRDMTRLAGTDRWQTAQFVGRLASGDTAVGSNTEDEAGASQRPTAGGGAYTAVSAGYEHSCGLRTDGSVTCWGSDAYDQTSASSVSVAVAKQNADADWCGWSSHYLSEAEWNLFCWPANEDGDPLPPNGSNTTLCGHQPQLSDSEACLGLDPTLAFSSVSAGRGYSCGVRADRTLTCWGLNQFGQADAPAGAFTAVSAGHAHTCGLRTDRTIECWGSDEWGESTAPSGTFTAVSVGWGHSCGLRTNGTLKCWGDNEFGQLAVPPGTFVSVSTGFQLSCGLRTDGTVKCWGERKRGQVVVPPSGTFAALAASGAAYWHFCGLRNDGTIECWTSQGLSNRLTSVPKVENFVAASVANQHVCGLRADGSVECWGVNERGQTSVARGPYAALSRVGDAACALRTDGSVTCWGGVFSPTSGTFAAVSVGGEPKHNFACGLRTDGTVTCWGATPEFGTDGLSGRYSAIAAGSKHVCALRTDGTVACWGDNARGQTSVPSGTFTDISALNFNTCVLRTDNTAVCWGEFEPFNGEFHAKQPSYAKGGVFAEVSAGAAHTCGRRSDGSVDCWGPGGPNDDPPGTFAAISTANRNNCGLRADGSPYCWGMDYYDGQLDGLAYKLSAISVGEFAAYGRFCGILANGWVRCFGGRSSQRIALPS